MEATSTSGLGWRLLRPFPTAVALIAEPAFPRRQATHGKTTSSPTAARHRPRRWLPASSRGFWRTARTSRCQIARIRWAARQREDGRVGTSRRACTHAQNGWDEGKARPLRPSSLARPGVPPSCTTSPSPSTHNAAAGDLSSSPTPPPAEPRPSLPPHHSKVLRSKENTGRVVVWRQLSLAHSYTLEASFCGADFGRGAGLHFSTRELRAMGAAFVPALLALVDPVRFPLRIDPSPRCASQRTALCGRYAALARSLTDGRRLPLSVRAGTGSRLRYFGGDRDADLSHGRGGGGL